MLSERSDDTSNGVRLPEVERSAAKRRHRLPEVERSDDTSDDTPTRWGSNIPGQRDKGGSPLVKRTIFFEF